MTHLYRSARLSFQPAREKIESGRARRGGVFAIARLPAFACVLVLWGLLAGASPPSGSAQQEAAPAVRLSSRVVTLDVLVLDKRTGARIDGLRQEDFQVLDDGRLQEVTYFSQGMASDRPLALVLLATVGTLESNRHLPDGLRRALDQLRDQDEVAVMIHYGGYEILQELIHDREKTLQALSKVPEIQVAERKQRIKRTMPTWGGSFRLDPFKDMAGALLAGMRHAQQRRPGARVALVEIDNDLSMALPPMYPLLEHTAAQLNAAGATVNGLIKVSHWAAKMLKPLAVVLFDAQGKGRSRNIVYFARETGGEVIAVKDWDYSSALEKIIGDMLASYSVGFEPEESALDGTYHTLSVKVRIPKELGDGKNVVVRARGGYVASKRPPQ